MISKQVKDWFLKNGLPHQEQLGKLIEQVAGADALTLFNDPENEAEDEFPEDEAEDEDEVEDGVEEE